MPVDACALPDQPLSSPWAALSALNAAIPLEAGRREGELRLEGGRLVLSAPGRRLALDPWPRLAARRLAANGSWFPTDRWADGVLSCWPNLEPNEAPARDPFDILLGLSLPRRLKTERANSFWPFSAYFDRIPPALRAEAGRYRRRRWHLLLLFQDDGRFLELSASNPALAFALASAWRLRPGTSSLPEGMAGWKRRDILGWLGFPPTESSVRALGKLRPEGLSEGELLTLRKLLHDHETREVVSGMRRLSPLVIKVLGDGRLRHYSSPRLFSDLGREVCESCPDCQRVCPLFFFDRCLGLERALGFNWEHGPYPSFGGLLDWHNAISRLMDRRNWEKALKRPGVPLPPPPFPGNAVIQPITSDSGLYAEGLEMSNCVPVYRRSALAGESHFYRVLEPVRATLMVQAKEGTAGPPWKMAEIRGPKNEDIEPEIAQAIWRELVASAISDKETRPTGFEEALIHKEDSPCQA